VVLHKLLLKMSDSLVQERVFEQASEIELGLRVGVVRCLSSRHTYV